MLLEDLARAGPLDALFLDLHGAMVTEHLEDGEGELLRRIRELAPDLPIVAALDLHANVSRAMVEHADALVAYRTYPHIDLAVTGARCLPLIERLLAGRPPGQGLPPDRLPDPAAVAMHHDRARALALRDAGGAGGVGLDLHRVPGR